MQIKRDGPEITFAYVRAAEVDTLFLGSKAVQNYYASMKRTDELEEMCQMLSQTPYVGSFTVVCHLEVTQRNREIYFLKRNYEIPLTLYGSLHHHLRVVPVRIDGRDDEFFYSPRNSEGKIVDFLHGGKLTRTKI